MGWILLSWLFSDSGDAVEGSQRTHLAVTPQINECLEIREGLDVVGDIVHFRSLEGAVAGIPCRTWVRVHSLAGTEKRKLIRSIGNGG